MPCTKRALELFTLAVLLCGLAGCPLFFPVLQVSPLALHFDATDEIRTFRISNGGAGTLNWEATTEAPGVYMVIRETISEKQGSNSITGSLTNQTAVIEVRIDRTLFPRTGAEIVVTSNAGEATVLLTASAIVQGRATFELTPTSLDYGVSLTQQNVSIRNGGSVPLEWTVQSKPDWVTINPTTAGTVLTNQTQSLAVRVNRSGLVPGDYTEIVVFNSNAGVVELTITMTVPPFYATPVILDFGTISQSATLTLDVISNVPACPTCQATNIDVLPTTESGVAWFTVDSANFSLPPSTTNTLNVTADPSLVTPGAHAGQITLRDTATGFEFLVEVRMARSSIVVTPVIIDFGSLFDPASETFTVTNIGNTAQTYNVIPPTGQQTWLSIEAAPATVTPGAVDGGETDTFVVTADPTNVLAGTYTADIIVTYQGGQSIVRVIMRAEKAADLVVTPQNINFSTTRVQESIGIINGGTTGTINWSIDTNTFPAWLSLRPVGGGGIASGTLVGGNAAQSVILEVDRDQIPDDVSLVTFSFGVVGTGDVNETEMVNVTVGKTLLPRIVVEGQTTSNEGVEQIIFPEAINTRTFVVRNEGVGGLEWNVIGILDPNDPNQQAILPLPSWIQGISPMQDSLDPGLQQTVSVNVTRTGLNFLGARATLVIGSNDPNTPRVPLFAEVIVPKVSIIGVAPATISFENNDVSAFFEIANVGDPGTELIYTITSNKDWVSFFPQEGRSIGTESPLKDWQLHSVSVDRSQLLDAADSATLTVRAIKPGTNGELDVTVDAKIISIIVQVPQLSIESPRARQRIPSLTRHVVTLRNLRSQIITLSEAFMPQLLNGISVFENNLAVEPTEGRQLVKLATADRVRTNLFVLLDYSNSMQTSASLDPDPAISGAPDPLQALYERTISQLISELPGDYRIGLGIFNERSAFENPVRVITSSSAETAETDGETFIRDKNVLLQRLDDISVVDNGATELLPAFVEAAFLFYDDDFYQNLHFPFDDADQRILLCVTDGRLTTPPGSVSTVAALMETLRVKFLPVTWGDQVQTDVLIQIATRSGGHLYSTNRISVPDGNGNIQRRPSVTTLENWMATDIADSCDQSIAKDLQNQLLFSYVSLNEEGATIRVNFSFNDPNDTLDIQSGVGGCLDDQGVISNGIQYSSYPMMEIIGDVNLGQINMQTKGIVQDGNGVDVAEIFIGLDAAPRNINQLGFTIGLENDPPTWDPTGLVFTHQLASGPEAGVISNWNDTGISPSMVLASPDGTPLPYGEHGRMVKVTVRHTDPNTPMQDFRLNLAVDSPVFNTGAVNEKYFTAPDSIIVRRSEEFKATSFPRPAYTNFSTAPFTERPFRFDLGSNIPFLRFDAVNQGGSHAPTGVWLNVDFLPDNAFVSSANTFPPTLLPTSSILVSTYDSQDIFVYPNRCLPAGSYIAVINPVFHFGSLHNPAPFGPFAFNAAPIYVHYSVTAPQLSVTPAATDIELAPAENEYSLTVTNTGQGVLDWSIDAENFPSWLSSTVTSGSLNSCTGTSSQSFNLIVNRSQISGVFPPPHTFVISSNGGSFVATVELIAGALSITPDISNIQVTGPNATFPIQLFNFGDAASINWNVVNPQLLPSWLTFSQNSGTLLPLEQLVVDIQVTGATPLPISQTFQIQSEGTIFNGRITVNP